MKKYSITNHFISKSKLHFNTTKFNKYDYVECKYTLADLRKGKGFGMSDKNIVEEAIGLDDFTLPSLNDDFILPSLNDIFGEDENFNDNGIEDESFDDDEEQYNVIEEINNSKTLNDLIECVNILNDYNFKFDHNLNNGKCIFSEFCKNLDRLNDNNLMLIKFMSNHYNVYEISMKKAIDLYISSSTLNEDTLRCLEEFKKCINT